MPSFAFDPFAGSAADSKAVVASGGASVADSNAAAASGGASTADSKAASAAAAMVITESIAASTYKITRHYLDLDYSIVIAY